MVRKLAAGVAVLGVAGFGTAAVAGDRDRDFATDLNGFEEVPSVSTTGNGQIDAEVNRAGTQLRYTLRYRNLEGAVQQAHIHFGQEHTNGGIVVFLCSNLGNGPAGTPECPPPPATVTDVLDADDVSAVPASNGAIQQGIGPREFAEFIRAMRAGATYANVHSDRWPAGEIRGQFDDDRGRGHDGDSDSDSD